MMMPPAAATPTAQIADCIASGDSQSAVSLLTALIQEVSGRQPANVRIHTDCTSLNSVNGRRYPITLRQAFVQAKNRLAPGNFGPGPAIVAHGDAHNGNVWVEPPTASHPPPRLTLFDPAFAGAHVPALLAEVKASFHNIFAHPFWLYEPDACKNKFQVQARRINQEIQVETDFAISDLRRHFLESKATLFWRPLLSELKQRDWLDPNWRQTMRAALFACPTLVMNLRAGTDSGHNPVSSAIGCSQAIQAAVAPIDGSRDDVEDFLAMMI